MTSFGLTGSPWYLLLLAPGLWILWRQYRGPAGRGPRGAALLALQGAALLLLVASLTGPELVRRTAEYRDPAVAILRDRSGSFAGGAYLGLGEAYAEAERAITDAYRKRGFEVRVADFHESAWGVSGFPGGPEDPGTGEGETPLTGFASLADFLDSTGGPNLQAAFLFSDGRANLDSGLAPRAWPVPVFPMALPVAGLSEAQPDKVSLLPGPASAGSNPGSVLEVAWSPVGPPAGPPSLRVLQGGRTLFTSDLPPGGPDDAPRTARIPWRAPASALERPGSLRAVVQPTGGRGNTNPWNDTVGLAAAPGRGGRRLLAARPLRSLDEKGMMDLLRGLEDVRVGTVAIEEIGGARLTAQDQLWVEAGFAAAEGPVLEALRRTPARVVLYARPGTLPASLAGRPLSHGTFTPAAEVRPARAAADAFPSAVVRLRSVSAGPLEVPLSGPPWREAAVLAEGGRRGLWMGWLPLGPGKEALFLALPPVWSLIFDPQADFAVRENAAGLLEAASVLADREEGAVKAVRPRRAYAGLPFDLEFRIPDPAAGGASGALVVRAREAGGRSETWEPEAAEGGVARLEDRALPAGSWTLELTRGGQAIWRDSLPVLPKAALELLRVGFDRRALAALAAQSGGRLLEPGAPAAPASAPWVTSMLPELPGAQIRIERASSTRLYNTRSLFLLAVGLLAASWLLRKRWDLD